MSTALTREVGSISMWNQSRFRIKRNFWSVFERTFRVSTLDGQLIMLVKHPLLRFREEFMVYADEEQTAPLLVVKSRQIIAINFMFDIVDAVTGEPLGSVQKRGVRSLVRDRFLILDPAGNEIGMMEETGASILRRFLPILTSRHSVILNGREAARMRQIFRLFTKEFEIEIAQGVGDPRFILACALLALMAEARREDN
ncbi:MAG TPA: hypothetical protein VNO33_05750 [Kofleriaceae bacterium]|nr:hypothetical protein [Kofleriaceae bacterium]